MRCFFLKVLVTAVYGLLETTYDCKKFLVGGISIKNPQPTKVSACCSTAPRCHCHAEP